MNSVSKIVVIDDARSDPLAPRFLREQRIEILGQIAGGVVHDVNNMLTAISGNATLAEGETPEKAAVHLANIHTCVRRGASLLRQILMFARASDSELVPTSTSLLVHETAAALGEMLNREIHVTFDAPSDLPDILGDSNQLRQVLTSFCHNARDAMPVGGSLHLTTALVRLGADQASSINLDAHPGDYVTLTVRDSGSGMAPEVRARLFEPFFTTKSAAHRAGLGLAMVDRVIRRHGGFVGVETAIGKGTRFTCYFPLPATPPVASGG